MSCTAERHVLIVEDDADASANIVDILELDGFTSDTASSIAQSLEQLRANKYSTIILDRKLPDGQSIDVLPQIRQYAQNSSIVVVTGLADLDGAVQALRNGASDYILKPINADALRATLRRLDDAKVSRERIESLSRDLRRREAEIATLLDVFPSEFAIAIADDPRCEFIHASDSFARTLGIPPTTNASLSVHVPGRPRFHFTAHGRTLAAEELPLQQSAKQGKIIQAAELDVVRSDASVVHLLCYSSPLYDEDGKPRGAIGAFLDITERRKAQQALEQSEQLFHAIFDCSMDGILVLDDDGCIVDANAAACRNFGLTEAELKGTPLSKLLWCESPDGFSVLWKSLTEEGRAAGECQAIRSDGRMVDVEFRAAATFIHGLHMLSIRDVTDRKRAEQRLLQSERLAAIGETMAGLAHESRNALQRSRACLELLTLEIGQQPAAVTLVERVLRAQNRLQELYEEVREYAAPIKLDSRLVDLRRSWRIAWKHIVEATPEMTLRLVEDSETEPSQWECTADPYRLEQVFLNIFENAMHASPPHSAIHVRCQDTTLGEKPAVQISIQDEGSGMSREQRENIFEAFFTTKTKGTGLGMAIVRRIVHAHGGRISVADHDGPGTEILLQLPVQ